VLGCFCKCNSSVGRISCYEARFLAARKASGLISSSAAQWDASFRGFTHLSCLIRGGFKGFYQMLWENEAASRPKSADVTQRASHPSKLMTRIPN
jgi:hypothetical protein